MTQSIEQAVAQFVKAGSTPAGNNVFPKRMPSTFTGWPAIVYTKVSGHRSGTHSGTAFREPRFQFSCYSTSYADAKRTARAVADLFDQFAGTMGFYTRVTADVDNEIDIYDDENKLYHTVVDVLLVHTEPTA